MDKKTINEWIIQENLGKGYYLVKCPYCDNQRRKTLYSMRNTTSCGCQQKKLFIGAEIGNWKVLDRTDTPGIWEASCICGKIVKRKAHELKKYHSCGCLASDQRKKTTLEKYGVEHHMHLKKYKNLASKNGKRNNRKQSKQTCLEKYGVENVSQLREVQEKKKKTMLANYGIEQYLGSKDQKQKAQKTCLEKYGANHFLKTKQGLEKLRKSVKNKYQVEHVMHLDSVKAKFKKTNLDKYGVEYPAKLRSKFIIGDKSVHQLSLENNKDGSYGAYLYRHYGEKVFLDYLKQDRRVFSTEIAFINIIKPLLSVEKYDRTPKEFSLNRRPDFRLEKNNKIAYVNVDGLYDHSEIGRRKLPSSYHLKLGQAFRDNNQMIFQFREDELQNSSNIILSILKNYFGESEKIFARKCKIEKVGKREAFNFLTDNHLMGPINSSYYGLYFQNEIVALMGCRKKQDKLIIDRFCTKKFNSVVGGFSKLLRFFLKLRKPKQVESFLDLRYSTGKSYTAMGFKLKNITLGWKWTNFKQTFNRLRCRANMDGRKLSQAEHAQELGWYKIYDAGQARYVLEV